MIFSKDKFDRLDRPYTYLAKPNKDYIGTIQARDLSSDLCFTNISQSSFKVNKYEDGVLTSHYNEIENLNLIEISYVGWFQITNTNKVGDGNNEYLEVTIGSLENESCSKTLTSFGQLGVSTDEQGGLDRYKLVDYIDTDHSVLHIWLEKMPTWSIGFVDPEITTEYRTFTNDEVGAYSFLVEDVATTYECIFQFDTFNQTVSAYKLENIGVNTSIYLSYDNLINNTALKVNASDIITVYTVVGGDDNGSPLGIIDINPSGTNQIFNFSNYKRLMSTALRDKLDDYEDEYNSRLVNFSPAIDLLKTYYEDLNQLNNKLPSVSTSTNWTEYGLVALKTKYDVYNNNMSIYIGKSDSTSITNYNTNYTLRQAVNAELNVRQLQVNAKELQITNQKITCENLTINLADYLGTTLYKELSRYYHEATFTDDTYVVTKSMTSAERLDMQRSLLDMAQKDLAKKCKPSYTLEVDVINFTTIPEFQKYTDQLALGNIMTIDFGNDILVEARLLKLHVNWDNPTDFSMVFSSKNRLDGWDEQLAEAISQSNGATSAYTISGTGWNTAKNKTSTFDQYMSSNFDLQKQRLIGGTKETFITDGTGSLWRKWDDATNDYSPNQMWGTSNGLFLSRNAFNNVSMAIGDGIFNGQSVYGVWCDVLVGRLLLSQTLKIENANSSIVMNETGASFVNCGIQITKGTNVLTLNATDGIKLTKNGVSQFYLDGNGDVIFSGKLQAASGSFSGNITSTSGNIGGWVIGSSSLTSSSGATIHILRGSNESMLLDDNGLSLYNPSVSNSHYGDISSVYTGGIGGMIISQGSNANLFAIGHNTGSSSYDLDMIFTNSGFSSGAIGNYTAGFHFNRSVNVSASLTVSGQSVIHSGNIGSQSVSYAASAGSVSNLHTSSIIPDDTGNGNINFIGSMNAATPTWVAANYEPLGASDFRLKKNIRTLEELPDSLYFSLKTKLFEYKCEPYKKNTSIGLLAQEVVTAFKSVGLDAFSYNIVEISTIRPYTDEGFYITDGKLLRINYEQFTAWGILINQKQQLKLNEFELRLCKLESA